MVDDRDGIARDLIDQVEPDGSNAYDVICDLAAEYGVSIGDVSQIYEEMNKL